MNSLNIYFVDKNHVECRTEPVREPEAGEVMIRARKSLISTGTELISLGGLFAPDTHWDRWIKYPHLPGYSMVGTIESLGEGVVDFQVGDRIAVSLNHRQHFVAPASLLIRVPEGVPDEDAAWFWLAMIAQNAVRRASHLLGDAVVIVGAGLLGQLVTQYVRLMGARQVIVIDPAEPRLAMAKAHGATITLAKAADAAYQEVMALTGGKGAEVVYDVTGLANVLETALKMVRNFGSLVLLGDTGDPSAQHLTGDVVTRGLRIIGAHANNPHTESNDHIYWSKRRMVELFYTYLLRGDMRVNDLITHRYAPQDAPEAYHQLQTDRSGAMGVIFDWAKVHEF
jgi:2-desacetyl-2-hydroxyethyl bacteriochlorophyllide A dehydrogenase